MGKKENKLYYDANKLSLTPIWIGTFPKRDDNLHNFFCACSAKLRERFQNQKADIDFLHVSWKLQNPIILNFDIQHNRLTMTFVQKNASLKYPFVKS